MEIKYARKSKILGLSPFIDESGLMRNNSRLKNSNTYDFKKTSWYSGLKNRLGKDAHSSFEHPVGKNAMRGALSCAYIIVGIGTLCHYLRLWVQSVKVQGEKHSTKNKQHCQNEDWEKP